MQTLHQFIMDFKNLRDGSGSKLKKDEDYLKEERAKKNEQINMLCIHNQALLSKVKSEKMHLREA